MSSLFRCTSPVMHSKHVLQRSELYHFTSCKSAECIMQCTVCSIILYTLLHHTALHYTVLFFAAARGTVMETSIPRICLVYTGTFNITCSFIHSSCFYYWQLYTLKAASINAALYSPCPSLPNPAYPQTLKTQDTFRKLLRWRLRCPLGEYSAGD